MLGKARNKKPYHEAAALAARLVLKQNDDINVILTIVQNKTEESDKLKEFLARLDDPRIQVIVEPCGKVNFCNTIFNLLYSPFNFVGELSYIRPGLQDVCIQTWLR